MDYTGYCQDCKRNTEIVLDHSTGDTICIVCGLVLESFYIDEVSEWRTFSDENNDKDPNRVGTATNPLLTHANLTTIISKPKGTNGDFLTIPSWHTPETDPDKALKNGFEIISTMADRLCLMKIIEIRASEIFKNVEDRNHCKGRIVNAISAACLFIACRENKSTRTLKEICTVADGVSKKEIVRAVGLIKKQLDFNMGTMLPVELVKRFCSNLGMKNHAVKAVQEALEKSDNFDIRRNPKSVLAAIIYIITQLSDEKKPLRDISVAIEVAEGTIKKAYKDLYPHASRLTPNWYAKEEDLKKLSRP